MKHRIYKALVVFTLLAGTQAAYAAPECIPTPQLATQHYPGAAAIPSTNNLLLPTGKSIESDGQRLVIHGQVLDRNCKPVPEAVVELWQANPYGKVRIASNKERATPHAAFAGAGRAVTDSDGQFAFTTSFPGVGTYWLGKQQYTVRAPQVNLRITTPGMRDFATVLYFESDRRNDNDPVYKRLSLERRSAVTMQVDPQEQNLYSTVRLVLPTYAPYRTY